MMKKYVKQELRWGINSKIYYIVAIFLSLLFVLTLFLNYSAVINTYDSYLKTENYYVENGLDIEKDLAGEYNLEENENGGTVSNPILYYKDTVSRHIYAASPKYMLSQLLESSILLFPLVFGILGLLVASTDFKYKTIKLKTVRMDRSTLGIVKQLSIVFSSFIILVITLIISYLIGWIMYIKLSSSIPIEEFNVGTFNASSLIIVKFIFAYIIALIFAEIGYTLGMIFKNSIIGMIVIIVYIYILPNLGRFDLKNSYFYFARKVFDFYGVVSVQSPKETSLIVSTLIILSVIIISFIANMFIIVKRSSFES
ncbi:hypothetical protein GOQ27_09040 [Clostridium sp. D2Q-11]|uniref:ABC-2 family transporter protein n=1 Tax=Anaeromonas frigoriresistens TaxID=2683708 RepID=A0A942UT19_9FIRM|nr:hypothetical protein [Anaeromonas frigoriresistens]MBS4538608.1 hypothetical protein [Anaeromonas frigoriresistens]